jgi:hypothetical protein
MALEDVKDQIKEKFSELWGRVQESPAYNNFSEKYETLSPTAQRGIKIGAIALAFLILVSIPFSYFSSSSSSDADYEGTLQLIRSLLRASRMVNANLPPPVSPDDFKASLQGDIAEFNLLPEQVGAVEDLNPENLGVALAPKSIIQQGVSVALKKLNLKQVVEIGYRLQGKNASVKLVGLDVRASAPDPHYFDVIYQMVIYSLPFTPADAEAADDTDTKASPKGGSKAPNKPSGGNARPKTSGPNNAGPGAKPKFAPPPEEAPSKTKNDGLGD